ncbi:hypothetical protein PTI98_004259 [Pleurotus ostreatus]|nr:hypothetical protein PTI98_004259 [Pleurotus ostreatus]
MSTISTLTTNWHLRAQEASYFISHSILTNDYLTTLDMEVQLIWGKTFGLVSYLFVFNRYFPLAAWASFAFPAPSPDDASRIEALQRSVPLPLAQKNSI